MNLMFIIYGLSGNGGAEHVSRSLLNRLSRIHTVTLVTLEEDVGGKYDLDPAIDSFRIPDKPVYFRHIPKLRHWDTYDWWSFYLKYMKQRKKIDCAISFLEQGNYMNLRSKTREKVIVSIRNMMSLKNRQLQLEDDPSIIGYRKYKENANQVVCVSRVSGYDQIHTYGIPSNKIYTIYNYCDTERIDALSKEPINDPVVCSFLEKHSFIYLHVGRLNKQKGQWHLIRAFSEIHRNNSHVGLLILGQGDLQSELKAMIQSYKLEKSVCLAGYKDNPFPYYRKAHVFVLSSEYEGFSNALLEAMACSLPVISTDCLSGPAELLDPDRDPRGPIQSPKHAQYGILTPVGSMEPAFEKKEMDKQERFLFLCMKELLEDEELRKHYCQQSRIRIKDFAPEVIIKQWEERILD